MAIVSNAQERISQRANGCKAARTACSLIDINDMPKEVKAGFWLEILSMMPEELKQTGERKLTDDEAVEFESTTISFGTHSGKVFSEVPIGYLTWIADSTNQLQAYLKSDRGQKRIEAGE